MLLATHKLSKSFGGKPILTEIDMTVEDNVCYGLIGVNGAGKSTLLSIITGELEQDQGECIRREDLRFGILKQNSGLERSSTIMEEMHKVFEDVLDAERQMRLLEKEMAAVDDHSSEEYRRLTAAYTQKQAYFDSRDGYQIDVKIHTILNGMGFMDKQMDTPIYTLSGGEKTRLAIARLLLEEPELLILDEPTNHLDFKTLNWLEEYLLSYKGAVLAVSHDRYFLDKITTQIFELERGTLITYKGNYSAYLRQRQERRARQEKEYEAQQQEIARLQTYVDKNITRASTANSAKSRMKALENMEVLDKPQGEIKPIKLKFEKLKESYKDVLSVQDLELAVGTEHKVLCTNLNLELKRGEKVAMIGENGVGKSSFLKAIQGLIPHAYGEVIWGKNTSISYYEQENLNLNPDRLAIDELWDRFPHIPEAKIRSVLGNVRLTKDDVYKPVRVISGGERAKLALCILMLEKANTMLLDEPTNHLDLPSKEILEDALTEYDGTLLFVSHDRYLLNKLPDKIIEMTKEGVVVYEGNYEYYKERSQMLQRKSEVREAAPEIREKNNFHRSKEHRRLEAQRKNRIRQLETLIQDSEQNIEQLEQELALPEIYADYKLAAEKTENLENLHAQLEGYYEEWENLQEAEETGHSGVNI